MASFQKKAITTDKAPSPVGPYNQAILINSWLYCSGQIALDPNTNKMIKDQGIELETKQVLQNLIEVLKAGGASTSDVVKTTIYLVNLKDFEKVNTIYSEVFGEGTSPARACIQVSALPKGGNIEIDCVAITKPLNS